MAPPPTVKINKYCSIHWRGSDDVITLNPRANRISYDHIGKQIKYINIIQIEEVETCKI